MTDADHQLALFTGSDSSCYGAELADLALLAEPFPRQGPDPEALQALLAVRPEVEDFEEIEEIEDFDDAVEAWDERWEPLMFAPQRTAGAIVISHLGCAQREWLIISGTHRGTIWSDRWAGDVDLTPLRDPAGQAVTFTRWYTDWLRQAELIASRPLTDP